MSPPIFRLDDEVEIIGVTSDGVTERMGERFVVSQYYYNQGSERCSAVGFPWYPASSLRLVEELKIGDWVEVIGGDVVHPTERKHPGQIFKITHKCDTATMWPTYYTCPDTLCYPAKSLRKLTPEEIPNQSPFTLEQRLASLEDYTRENDKRLSAIEKRLDASEQWQEEAHDMITDRLCALEERQGRIGRALWGGIYLIQPCRHRSGGLRGFVCAKAHDMSMSHEEAEMVCEGCEKREEVS